MAAEHDNDQDERDKLIASLREYITTLERGAHDYEARLTMANARIAELDRILNTREGADKGQLRAKDERIEQLEAQVFELTCHDVETLRLRLEDAQRAILAYSESTRKLRSAVHHLTDLIGGN